jgi:hypothetical protein
MGSGGLAALSPSGTVRRSQWAVIRQVRCCRTMRQICRTRYVAKGDIPDYAQRLARSGTGDLQEV